MIIQETNGSYQLVRETGNPDMAHVWFGTEVKKVAGGFAKKKNAKERLVRKEAATIIQRVCGSVVS